MLEETAISLYDVPVTYCYTTEAVIDKDNHWITVFMVAEVAANVEASNEEPEKCEVEWMRWDEVPTPRFRPLDNILGDGAGRPARRRTERRERATRLHDPEYRTSSSACMPSQWRSSERASDTRGRRVALRDATSIRAKLKKIKHRQPLRR